MRTERFALIGSMGIIVALDAGMIWTLSLSPLMILPSLVVLGFAIAEPSPRLARWRDGFLILLLLSRLAHPFASQNWPYEIRLSMGVLAGPSIGLLFIAWSHGDGLGAQMRRLSLTRIGRSIRTASHYISELASFAVFLTIVVVSLYHSPSRRELVVVPIVLLISSLLPARWRTISKGIQVLGCLPLPILAVGALAQAWSFSLFWLFLASTAIADAVEKLRGPVPPPRPWSGRREEALSGEAKT